MHIRRLMAIQSHSGYNKMVKVITKEEKIIHSRIGKKPVKLIIYKIVEVTEGELKGLKTK